MTFASALLTLFVSPLGLGAPFSWQPQSFLPPFLQPSHKGLLSPHTQHISLLFLWPLQGVSSHTAKPGPPAFADTGLERTDFFF